MVTDSQAASSPTSARKPLNSIMARDTDCAIAVACTPICAECATSFKPFRGGAFEASARTSVRNCCGGQVLDFREASLPEDPLHIDVCILFGGVTILFPSAVAVNLQSIGISNCRRDTLYEGKNGSGQATANVTGWSCCGTTSVAVLEPGDRAPTFMIYSS